MKRKLYYAIDFDGTIVEHEFPAIGKGKPLIVEMMRRIHKKGDVIIIWTCRAGKYLEEAIKFLKDNDIPFDYVNENPEVTFEYQSPKIFANWYIDDRAMNVDDAESVVREILQEEKL